MADTKHPQLNGAYYGPPIPAQRNYRSVGHRSGCGPCCLFCTLFKFILSIVILLGIIVLVLWLVLRPNEIKVHATSASLKTFDISNGSLDYDLSMNLSIRNPNKRIGLYYDYIEAQAYYDDFRFGFDNSFPTFYQGHKNTSYIEPAFQGKNAVLGSSDLTSTYNKETSDGYYNIDVKLRPKLRLKVWIFKIHIKPKVTCDLKVPVPGSKGSFSETKCHVKRAL